MYGKFCQAWMVVVVGVVVAAGGCTKANPLSCLDGYCSDQEHPVCDTDGTIAGTAGVCVAVDCTPDTFVRCRGSEALTCSASGSDYEIAQCPSGCSEDPAVSGCKTCTPGSDGCHVHIVPQYLPLACDSPATSPALDVSESMSLDTGVDAICTGGIVSQPGAPDICVLHHPTISIRANKTLTVKGTRLLALLADGSLTVDGILDVGADKTTSGPGGGVTKSGGAGADRVGSGGAGFRTSGASGGSLSTDGGGGAGGSSRDATSLAVLVSGQRAASGYIVVNDVGDGGGGGGGVTLISCTSTASIVGTVDAHGGGGAAGTIDTFGNKNYGGGGGGAGGVVVVQGINVSITGQTYANGGGGGGGIGGQPGSNGTRSATMPAAGGAAGSESGAGGAGAISTAMPTVGRKPSNQSIGTPGGGGGAQGYLMSFAAAGGTVVVAPFASSPPFEANRALATK